MSVNHLADVVVGSYRHWLIELAWELYRMRWLMNRFDELEYRRRRYGLDREERGERRRIVRLINYHWRRYLLLYAP